MIIGVIGPPGSGKTVLLTYFALIASLRKIPILSNFATKISEPWDVTRKPPGTGFLLLFDEAGVVLNGRNAQTRFNKAFTRWLVQLRKINSDLLWTAQGFGQSDTQLRSLTDSWIQCLGLEGSVGHYLLWNKSLTRSRPFKVDLSEAFNAYDTSEVIEIPEVEAPKKGSGKLFHLE